MAGKFSVQLIALAVAAVVISGVAVVGVHQPPAALAAPAEAFPDAGKLTLVTNEKLDEVNANLKQVNDRLQQLLDLLRSGKVEVVTREKPAAPAAGAAEGAKAAAPAGGQ